MAKNIVLCLDGTGNQLKASGNTNIVKIYEMLDLTDPSKQVAFYDPGIGTFSAAGAWTPFAKTLTKLLGLAFGYGIKANLAEAYTYLLQTYEPGDKVFIFGFSRGAYTARLLAAMTYRAGLLRHGCENLVPYLVAAFTKGGEWSKKDWDTISEFTKVFGISIVEDGDRRNSLPIEFLGLFDSVKALGLLRWSPRYPFTRKLPRVKHVRHAISIDERRRPFPEYLVALDEDNNETDLVEAWFAGVHSDIGGAFESKGGLGGITLKWMVDEALSRGLHLRPRIYATRLGLSSEDATAVIHKNSPVWDLLIPRARPLPAGANIHASVRLRREQQSDYLPKLDPAAVPWVDEDWQMRWTAPVAQPSIT
jgi:uncharacterized protein (DUF2235 family)